MAEQWIVAPDADDAMVYTTLVADRIWNCFAIADLTPSFRQYCHCAVAREVSEPTESASCRIIRHPAFAVVSPFGEVVGVAAMLAQMALPQQAPVQALPEHLPLFLPCEYRGGLVQHL